MNDDTASTLRPLGDLDVPPPDLQGVEKRAARIKQRQTRQRVAVALGVPLVAVAVLAIVLLAPRDTQVTIDPAVPPPSERTIGSSLTGGSTVTAPCSTPSTTNGTPQTLSKADIVTVPDVISKQYESGWLPYSGACVFRPENADSGIQGWLRNGEIGPEPGKNQLYDVPNGRLIGWAYSQLGFVSLADDVGFDAHAERVKRFGCDQYAGIEPDGQGNWREKPGIPRCTITTPRRDENRVSTSVPGTDGSVNSIPTVSGNAWPSALLLGTLVAKNGCLYLQSGQLNMVLWADGSQLVDGGKSVRLPSGRTVGPTGTSVQIGGGEVPREVLQSAQTRGVNPACITPMIVIAAPT